MEIVRLPKPRFTGCHVDPAASGGYQASPSQRGFRFRVRATHPILPNPFIPVMLLKHRAVLALTALPLVFAAACGESSTEPTGPDIRDYITSVSALSGTVSASFVEGAPAACGSGPRAEVTGASAMILGGTAIRTVSTSATMTEVVISIDGVDGYWRLPVSGGATSTQVVLALAQEPPRSSFSIGYAAGSGGTVGRPDTESVALVTVGTGEVQVTLSWDAESDVDLHVVDPTGEEIYYGSSESSSGGELDLDSNAGCGIDGKQVENITWASGTAPRGTYTVRVNYWASCGVQATNYVVAVHVKGRPSMSYRGRLTGAGNGGGEGSGQTVATFTY